MKLKYEVENLDVVPEQFREMYIQDGGKFRMDVEGATSRTKLDEFRNNNVELKRQLESLQGVDVKRFQELVKLEESVRGKELLDQGKIDDLVNQRITSMRDEHVKVVENLNSQLTRSTSRLESLLIDSAVRSAATDIGVLGTAVDDVLLRARMVFKMDSENVVPLDPQGNVIYGSDGTKPLTISDWLKGLSKSAPHLFAGSEGGGSRGSQSRGSTPRSQMSAIQKISAGLS